ncbi:MAG: hypothetical protein E7616_07360 [Ruminococcaceae bacterium]|nr:hypothetical protein [Oscillospiraceae bacterium]
MKWNEMTTVKKLILVTGWIFGLAYIVFKILSLCDIDIVHQGISFAFFGVFWLSNGILQQNKIPAICYYVVAAAFFLLCLLYFLV